MPEEEGALLGASFILPGKFLRSTSGLDSSRRTFADVSVNDMRSHAGGSTTITLRQQQKLDMNHNDCTNAGRAPVSYTIGADSGRQHEYTNHINALQELCVRVGNDNTRLQLEAAQLELVNNNQYRQVSQLKQRVRELEAELTRFRTVGLTTGHHQSSGSFILPPKSRIVDSDASFAQGRAPASNFHSTMGFQRHIPTACEWTAPTLRGAGAPRRTDSIASHCLEEANLLAHATRKNYASSNTGENIKIGTMAGPDRHGCSTTTLGRSEHLAQPRDAASAFLTVGKGNTSPDFVAQGDLDTTASSPAVRPTVDFDDVRLDGAQENAAMLMSLCKQQGQGMHRSSARAAVPEAEQLTSDHKGRAEIKGRKGVTTPHLLTADCSSVTALSDAPSLAMKTIVAGTLENAATSDAAIPSLRDFWIGDTSRVVVSVTPDAKDCTEDANKSIADGADVQDEFAEEDRSERLGQSDSPRRTSVKRLEHPDKPDRDTSPGLGEQDTTLRPGTAPQDPVIAPGSANDLQSGNGTRLPQRTPPICCQAVETISGKGQASASDTIPTPKESDDGTTTVKHRQQPTLAVRPAGAEASNAINAIGASTHVTVCSYCNTPPLKDNPVAFCEECPRRLCVKCLRNNIQGTELNCGGLDPRTLNLLEGRGGDIFVEECPWCLRQSDLEFTPPSLGESPMKHLLQELMRHDLSRCFREPVDVEEHPDYLKAIGRNSMMDLHTMMSKLESRKYPRRRGPGQFVEDLCKIWRNCRKFAGCDELGQSLHGTSVPGIVRCALILEAISNKYVQSYISDKCDTEWPESAWDYYRQRRKREHEEARLKQVECKANGGRRGITTGREGNVKYDSTQVLRGSSNIREATRSDLQLVSSSEPYKKQKVRLEKCDGSIEGQEDGSHGPRPSLTSLGSKGKSSHVTWKPLEELCDVAKSFSRRNSGVDVPNLNKEQIKAGDKEFIEI